MSLKDTSNLYISNKGRIVNNGSRLTEKEVKEINFLSEIYFGDINLISEKLHLDPRTVEKYIDPNYHQFQKLGRKFESSFRLSRAIKDIIIFIFNKIPNIRQQTIIEFMYEKYQVCLYQSEISSILEEYNFKKKKATLVHKERKRATIQLERFQYRNWISNNQNNILFFVHQDESHFSDLDQNDEFAWIQKGKKKNVQGDKMIRKNGMSLLMAISPFGIVYYEIINSSGHNTNAFVFNSFLNNLSIRLSNLQILIMDNSDIHWTFNNVIFLQNLNIQYKFQSRYSPEYNPIELIFNVIKKWLKNPIYSTLPLKEAIVKILEEKITPNLCFKCYLKAASFWFKNLE